MDEVTKIYNHASDVLLELQVERVRTRTFNSILLNALVYPSIPVIVTDYERDVAEAVTASMCDSLTRIDKAAQQLETLLKELKNAAKGARA